jgi:CheY-like chemotaxis protein
LAHRPSSTKPRSPGQPTGCVLVVDDDDLVRETLVAQLEDMGFVTLAAGTGGEAIEMLDAYESVNAVVCDLAMPGLNGLHTIRAVHERRPGLPCFLLTGDMSEQIVRSRSDTFTLLRKPLSGAALAAHIEAALAG